MNKRYIGLGAAIIVVAFAVVLLAPPIMTYKSYEGFLKTVLEVKNLQVKGFDVEPLQPQFACIYYYGATDPARITKKTDISKNSGQPGKFNVLPLSSFGFIGAKNYFLKRYLLNTLTINGVEGFAEEFYVRFYDSSNHLLTMVMLEYAPGINKKMLLFGMGSPIELGIDGVDDTPPNDKFGSEVLKYLGGNKLNADVYLTMYTGKHFIASIFDFSPKTDSTEESARIADASHAFEQELLKTLYSN